MDLYVGCPYTFFFSGRFSVQKKISNDVMLKLGFDLVFGHRAGSRISIIYLDNQWSGFVEDFYGMRVFLPVRICQQIQTANNTFERLCLQGLPNCRKAKFFVHLRRGSFNMFVLYLG